MMQRRPPVFICTATFGASLIVAGGLSSLALISNGIAFITVKFVRILTSWFTFDVISSIADVVREVEAQTQETIREVGSQTQAVIREVGSQTQETIREVGSQTQEAILGMDRQNKDALDSFAQSQEHMIRSQERMIKSQETIIELLTRIAKNTEPSK